MMKPLASLVLACALLLGLAGHARAIELRDFDAASMDQIRAAHAGRPFVLAFWSVHCEPCRGEMAQWGPLRRRHPGVDIVLVATDRPSERKPMLEIMSRHDLRGVQTWAFADDFEERVRFAVDRSWRGELPRTYLFDSSHRAEVRSGPAELSWIEPWLARQTKDDKLGGKRP
jgi:hypothetical protein